jgi:dTDP-4-dehydrorhamnose reductase
MKILILGVTGMVGNTIFKYFGSKNDFHVTGTLRNTDSLSLFQDKDRSRLLANIDILDQDSLISTFDQVRPELVINCSGLVKQHDEANDPLVALPINSLLPHRLDRLCSLFGTRLIHFSTDCVFSGKKGMYCESDLSDATDLYGKSKFIGEIFDSPTTITMRKSVIGHELNSNNGLIEWFLSQSGTVTGYKKAIFSGMPTVELARIVEQYVIPRPELHGLYHVSVEPIDKMSLLKLVAKEYGKNIEIIPEEKISIDRSLDSSRFRKITGYSPPSWTDLINLMHKSQ